MDTRHDGLPKVPQRAWRWFTLRWFLSRLFARRQLYGADRVGLFVQLELQDVLEADVGGSGHHVRKGERLDHVDVEDGGCGRMVVSSRLGLWLDSEQPYFVRISQHLRLKKKRRGCVLVVPSVGPGTGKTAKPPWQGWRVVTRLFSHKPLIHIPTTFKSFVWRTHF